MSDTPKYSYWHLSEAEQRRLEAERKEMERLREIQIREAAEIRRKQRLAILCGILEQDIQLQEQRIQNLGTAFEANRFSGGEIFEEMRLAVEGFRQELSDAAWDEDARRVQKKIQEQQKVLDRMTDQLAAREKLLRELGSARTELWERPKLHDSFPGVLRLTDLASLEDQVRGVPEGAEFQELQRNWRARSEELRKACLLMDQQKRHQELSSGMRQLNRQFITGENAEIYQRLTVQLEDLKNALAQEDPRTAASALLQAEELFSGLEGKLEQDELELERRCRENGEQLEALSAWWRGARAGAAPGRMADLAETAEKLERELEQMQPRCRTQNTESFTQSADRLRKSMEAFLETVSQLERLEKVQEQLEGSVPPQLWETFAPNEAAELECRRSRLARKVQNRQCADFEGELEQLQGFLNSAVANIMPKVNSWNVRWEAVRTRLDAERDRWFSWWEDPAVRRWAEVEIAQKTEEFEAIQRVWETKPADLKQVEDLITEWRLGMECIEEAVGRVYENEQKRQNIVSRFQEEFRQLGFAMSEPELEDGENPASGLVLTASRPEGKTIHVRFAHDAGEPILYAVDGFPMPQQTVNGQEFRTCDEAERQLKHLHSLLEKHGILMGKIQWEDQPPTDLAREAMELPDAVDRTMEEG